MPKKDHKAKKDESTLTFLKIYLCRVLTVLYPECISNT
jgi:hypothetical protein